MNVMNVQKPMYITIVSKDIKDHKLDRKIVNIPIFIRWKILYMPQHSLNTYKITY